MSEANAKLFLTIMGVTAVIGYIIAIALGLQGVQSAALIFFIVALADTVATFFVFRYFRRLRNARWQSELSVGEEKMRQMLIEETKKQVTSDK